MKLEELAARWVTAQSKESGPENDGEWADVFEAQELSFGDPELLWQFVQLVLASNLNERALGMLAAGPLEDLIQTYGPQFIDRIEASVLINSVLAEIMPGVWVQSSQDAVTRRFIEMGCHEIGSAV